MKKTIHINLSGVAFTIEEDAYEKLNGYLKAVEMRLGEGDEGKETINDIESRIAELFAPVAHSSGAAIKLENVEEVIRVLGNPEDYETDAVHEDKGNVKPPPTYIPKRLYRDPHSRVLGGVCSGLGTYFNVDPIVFRLVFVIGLFYGISVLPYIILWIAIPKALTMEQRMQMYGGDLGLSRNKHQPLVSRLDQPSALDRVLQGVGVILGIIIIIGSFFAMVGLTIALAFTGKLASFIPNGAWIGDFPGLLVGPSYTLPAILGVVLFVGIPLLMLFYLGLQLVFQFKKGGKAIGAIGLILWLVGIGLMIFSGVSIATQFTRSKTISQTELLEPFTGDTLYLKKADIPEYFKGNRIMRSNGLQVWDRDGNLSVEGRPIIEINNDADQFAITIEKTACGSGYDDAASNASGAEYFWFQKDSVLQLDRIFTLAPGSLLREQEVRVILEIPEDKNVVIDYTISPLVR